MARAVLGETRMRMRRRRRRLLLLGGILLVLVLLFSGMLWLAHASFLRITDISVTGAAADEGPYIQNVAQDDLTGSYLFLFPKDNAFLYPRQEIANDLLRQFSTLQSVEVSTEGFHTLHIAAVDRQAVALWCGVEVSSTTLCFLLDGSGLAYAPAATFSGDAYQKYWGALATTTRQYLTPSQFQPLMALVSAIAQKESTETILGTYVDPSGTVAVEFASGFQLLLNLSDVGGDAFQHFTLALGADPFTSHPLSDFEYLDLRFGEKLYYKLR